MVCGHPGARWLAAGAALQALGMFGEQVVVGWLVLELTDSTLMVGVALGLQMLPMLLLGVPAGVVADRGHRVRLIQAASLVMTLCAGALGLFISTGAIAAGPVLALAFVTGCARTLQQTARQAYAHDVAGERGMVHLLALIALASRAGGLVGAMLVGALIARAGLAAAYFAVAAAYLASAIALLPAPDRSRARAASFGADVAGFFADVRRDRTVVSVMALTAAAEVLGFSHQALLPSLARDVLQVGPAGLGTMTGARQIGGLAGTLLAPALGSAHGHGRVFLAVLAAFGALLVALSAAPGLGAAVLVLVGISAVASISDVLSQTLIHLAMPAALRGRAGGAWVVAIGTAPLGQLQIGALASLVGVGAALGANGLALVALTAAVALLAPRLRGL